MNTKEKDNTWVKFAKDCGEYKAGDVVELDSTTAESLTKMGFACEAESPEDDAVDKIEKALNERDTKIVDAITKSLSRDVKVKIPAVARDDSDKSLGDWLTAIGNTSSNRPRETREKAFNTLSNKYNQKVSMSEGVNADGGYTVPVEYAKELLFVPGYEGAVYPSRIKPRPMGTKTQLLPALDQTISPSGSQSAFYAGVTIGIVAEGTAPSQNTQFESKQVALTAKKGLATAVVSNELLDDSIISIDGVLKDQFNRASTFFINWNLFNGAGNSTSFAGVINHAATITVNRANANKVQLQDCANMYAALAPDSRKAAAWYISPLVWGQLPMLGSVGGAAAHFVWLGNDATGMPEPRLFGLPIIPYEALPNLGSTADVVLADFRYYALGLRSDPIIDTSPHYLFPADQMVYRLKFRMDGTPQLTAPITLNGGGQVSPFVQLGPVAS